MVSTQMHCLSKISSLRLFAIRREFNCFTLSLRNKIKCFSMSAKPEPNVKYFKTFAFNQNKTNSEMNSNNSIKSNKSKPKAVLLYANEKSWFYRRLFALNVCQFFFWIYVSNQGIALILRKPKILTEDDIKEKLESDANVLKRIRVLWNENKLQMTVSMVVLSVGQLSMALLALFTIRSVRYILLSPSAQNVRITTFSMIGSPNRYRNYDFPLEQVSAAQHRNSASNYIPLKAKGKMFYFLVDTKGHFYKPSLFDQTVGLFRILK